MNFSSLADEFSALFFELIIVLGDLVLLSYVPYFLRSMVFSAPSLPPPTRRLPSYLDAKTLVGLELLEERRVPFTSFLFMLTRYASASMPAAVTKFTNYRTIYTERW